MTSRIVDTGSDLLEFHRLDIMDLMKRIMPFSPGHYYKDGKFICCRDVKKVSGGDLETVCKNIHQKLAVGLAYYGLFALRHRGRRARASWWGMCAAPPPTPRSSPISVIANIIVQERLRCPLIETAVSAAMDRIIGVDFQGHLCIEDAVRLTELDGDRFRTTCFGGEYPAGIPRWDRKTVLNRKSTI